MLLVHVSDMTVNYKSITVTDCMYSFIVHSVPMSLLTLLDVMKHSFIMISLKTGHDN